MLVCLKKLIKDNLINGFNSLTKKAMLSNEKFANTLVMPHPRRHQCKPTTYKNGKIRHYKLFAKYLSVKET